MPVELSYPGLKCVLEFLEANKRIHISSRSPRLKHIERCVPLYLNTLYFRPNVVKLNEITYAIVERNEETTDHPQSELKCGDILIGPRTPVYSRMYPTINFFKQAHRPVERRVQEKEGMQNYEIIRKVLQGLIGERKNIGLDQLVFEQCHSTILRLPSNFKVRIRRLDSGVINPEYLLPLIDFSSFPLKELRLRFPGKLDQPIVQSSEKLVIFVTEQYFSDFSVDILNLPNGSVIIECSSLSEDAYSNIIDYWLDEKRETGKCFMITGGQTKMIETAIDLMKKYDGKMVKWNSTEFSSNPQTNYISIPLNDDLVIAIYAVTHRKDKWNSSHQIVMKTMPINSFIPAEDFSEDKTLIEIKATENPRQNDLFVVSVFLSTAAIVLIAFFAILYKSFTNPTHN
ncbi:hypothetical protein GCK72_007317 [Caenorhabditis remanei]|uniref:Uncharacterized protein n=1 Tax=Caenorhabditis remanei TaxID=31234 RepID=A0A6A5HHN7_CAERE|nr:hypothetical protein GCK72_007317 [Caenorhabditis remanei]KAF1767358.1 hypothetical protein GCK72_007317 [Caenorhabditis remanei]